MAPIPPRLRRQARVWLIPAIYILIAIVLGRLLPMLDRAFPLPLSLFSPGTAATLLSAISSGMIVFTGFVFSMAIVMVQFGSSAYSPRLATIFLHDAVVEHSLGVFSASFVFALIAQVEIDPTTASARVPDITVLTAILLVLASLAMFLALIQRLTVLQVTNVLHRVGRQGRQVIEELYPRALGQGNDQAVELPELDKMPVTQCLYHRGGPAAVLELNIPRLVSLAQRAGGVIEVEYPVGDTVPDGAVLLRLRGTHQKLADASLRGCVILGYQRTIEQDPKYALRLIVDIAIRALSPAVNDPTTAVQALDQLDDLLRRVGQRRLGPGLARDRRGKLRLVFPVPDWEDFLALAVDEIRYYGAASLQVMRRLRALLIDLEETLPAVRRPAVQDQLRRVDKSIQRSFADQDDRDEAREADRQGIGLSRPGEEDIED